MTMSEQQQLKKKTRKSYAQLMDECESMQNKVAVVYVPQFCEALRDENPNMSHEEIRNKVFIDCRNRFGWGGKTGSTIYHNFPSWLVEDNPEHQKAVKRWEFRQSYKNISLAESANEKLKEIHEPPKPKEEPDEEFEYKMQEAQVSEYAGTGKSIRELTGAISKSGYDLIEALSNNSRPPSAFSDFINDYIKKSREFRRGVMLEVDENRRAELHNILSMTVEIAEDTIEIIDGVDKK